MGDWIDVNLPVGPEFDFRNGMEEVDSMSKRGLLRPGVLMEVSPGQLYLSGGHSSPFGGHKMQMCSGGCGLHLTPGATVKRYRVLWEGE